MLFRSNLTLNLTQAQEPPRTPVTVTVGLDATGVKEKLQSFVDAYNEVMTFIADGYNDSALGKDKEIPGGLVLRGDPAVNGVKRRMQALLTASVLSAGAYQSLADLGIATNRDGTLTLNSTRLDKALQADFDSVSKVLVGDDRSQGVMKEFKSYLLTATSFSDGLFATAKTRNERTLSGIDTQISRLEQRLESREKAIRAQFTALETLVSGMNETSNYLTQQSDMLKNLWSR